MLLSIKNIFYISILFYYIIIDIMKIFYQWEKWAYSHQVANIVWEKYNIEYINWVFSFRDLFLEVEKNDWLGIVPIENSYAGSVHENFFHLSKWKYKIIGEYYLDINHCLASTSKDIKSIKNVYSHYQALAQCENYLKNKWINPVVFSDTAWSAKYVKSENNLSLWAICSEFAANLNWLNILDKNIADQKWNTTRFFIVSTKDKKIDNFTYDNKISILFKVKDTSAVLYKCLWAFATRNINLTKIESLPTQQNKFEYMFYLEMEKKEKNIFEQALDELSYFAYDIEIIWDY